MYLFRFISCSKLLTCVVAAAIFAINDAVQSRNKDTIITALQSPDANIQHVYTNAADRYQVDLLEALNKKVCGNT